MKKGSKEVGQLRAFLTFCRARHKGLTSIELGKLALHHLEVGTARRGFTGRGSIGRVHKYALDAAAGRFMPAAIKKARKPHKVARIGNNFEQVDNARKSDRLVSEFYVSYDWRKLRMEILKLYGRRCQCCGATPDHGVVIHVDHIKPLRFFWDLRLDMNNLQVLCEVCNHGKGNWDRTDWRSI